MESCHELLGEVLPQKREYVVARLKRRFDGYRSRHSEVRDQSQKLFHQTDSRSLIDSTVTIRRIIQNCVCFQAIPLYRDHTDSLFSQEREHTQQLQQRFLESKTKKSKKEKASVSGNQPRGAHHSHGATHQLHQQSMQYMDSNVRVVVSFHALNLEERVSLRCLNTPTSFYRTHRPRFPIKHKRNRSGKFSSRMNDSRLP